MASMIPSWFVAQMARMADLRNAPSALTMWWEGLSGLPQDVLEAAVTHAIQTRTFFPTPAELREDADVAYRRPMVPEPSTYACETCLDTGWAPVESVAVTPCACRESNPVLQARRVAQARYASGRVR